MAYKEFLIAVGLAVGACADAAPDEREDVTVVGGEADQQLTNIDDINAALDPQTCEFVETEGPCADACDPEALQEHVPDGYCYDWLCHLPDGSTVRVGACNWRDPPAFDPMP